MNEITSHECECSKNNCWEMQFPVAVGTTCTHIYEHNVIATCIRNDVIYTTTTNIANRLIPPSIPTHTHKSSSSVFLLFFFGVSLNVIWIEWDRSKQGSSKICVCTNLQRKKNFFFTTSVSHSSLINITILDDVFFVASHLYSYIYCQ